jgi:hypothetical protein
MAHRVIWLPRGDRRFRAKADIDFGASLRQLFVNTPDPIRRLICPTGRSKKSCQASAAKIFRFTEILIFRRMRSSRLAYGGAYRGRHET